MSARTQQVEIDGRSLTDWVAFHSVFAEKLGFPSYYGRNMNAWYDCLSSLPDESTVLALSDGDSLRLDVSHFQDLRSRRPDLAKALVDGVATVNRNLDQQREARLRGGVQPPLLAAVALSLSE